MEFHLMPRGAFSVVKEGIRKASGKKYAVKCISKKLIDKKELSLLEREIDIMKKLQHPNIIQLMEVIDSPDTLFLVLEL
jgi:serine/threonine protein kinase